MYWEVNLTYFIVLLNVCLFFRDTPSYGIISNLSYSKYLNMRSVYYLLVSQRIFYSWHVNFVRCICPLPGCWLSSIISCILITQLNLLYRYMLGFSWLILWLRKLHLGGPDRNQTLQWGSNLLWNFNMQLTRYLSSLKVYVCIKMFLTASSQ